MENLLDKIRAVKPSPGDMHKLTRMIIAEASAHAAMNNGNAEAMAEHGQEFEDIEGGQA